MPFGNRISRLLVLALTTAAIAAPVASAMPITPVHPGGTPAQDLRTEAARTSSDFVVRPDAPATAKVVVTRGDDGGGVDGPIAGLLIAGTLAAGCAMAALALARGPRIAH